MSATKTLHTGTLLTGIIAPLIRYYIYCSTLFLLYFRVLVKLFSTNSLFVSVGCAVDGVIRQATAQKSKCDPVWVRWSRPLTTAPYTFLVTLHSCRIIQVTSDVAAFQKLLLTRSIKGGPNIWLSIIVTVYCIYQEAENVETYCAWLGEQNIPTVRKET